MFKGKVYAICFVWIMTTALGVWLFRSTTPVDLELYQGIVEQKKQAAKTQQQRFNVHKHILLTEGDERLQWHLNSTQAEFIVDHAEDPPKVMEHFKNVEGIMQEELVYVLPDGREAKPHSNGKLLIKQANDKDPASWLNKDDPSLQPHQWVRCIKASEAIYNYQGEALAAQQVTIDRYQMPGHQLPYSFEGYLPFITGQAKSMEISLKNKEEPFHAYGFQLTLPRGVP